MVLFGTTSGVFRRLVALGVIAASLGAGFGLSLGVTGILADHNDPDVIHACVDNQTGDVRIVDKPDQCDTVAENQSRSRRSSLQGPERVLEWNQEGPTGPVGPVGPQGPEGPQGEPGLVWRGTWDNTTSYAIDDAVSH